MTRAITVRTHGRRAAALAVLALTTPMVLTACGEDEGHATPGPAKVAIEVTEQGQGKFALRAPTSVPAGLVEISLRVPAGAATHDAQIVRVTGDRTAQEVVAAVSSQGEPLPQWLTPAGGVGQTDGSAVGKTVQRLQPGRYFILDTDEPEGDDVKSYAQTGATAALEVTGEQSTANLPRSDATVTARDYAFDVSELADGRVRIAFRNAGTEPHHVVAFPYREGATLDAVKTFFTEEGEPSGPPPVDFAGATRTTALAGGEEQIAELDLRRGRYALLCFLSDRAGGPPHAMMGMVAEAVVR